MIFRVSAVCWVPGKYPQMLNMLVTLEIQCHKKDGGYCLVYLLFVENH
jgi:hypothetical protein